MHSFTIDEQRREERDRRETLFANAPTPVAASRPLGAGNEQYVTDVNESFEDVFGFDRETIVGEEVSDVLVPDGHLEEHGEFRRRTAGGEAITKRVERRTRDGTREFIIHIIPFGLDDDAPDGNYVWYTDVTDWSERERELRAFSQAVEHTGHAVYWTDPEGEIEYVNPAFEAQTGYAAEECDSDHLEHAQTAVERSLSLIADLRTLAVEGTAAGETEPIDLSQAAADSCWRTSSRTP